MPDAKGGGRTGRAPKISASRRKSAWKEQRRRHQLWQSADMDRATVQQEVAKALFEIGSKWGIDAASVVKAGAAAFDRASDHIQAFRKDGEE